MCQVALRLRLEHLINTGFLFTSDIELDSDTREEKKFLSFKSEKDPAFNELGQELPLTFKKARQGHWGSH